MSLQHSEPVKRLFFGFGCEAPWLEHEPEGRLINPAYRHMTIAFLGDVSFAPLDAYLERIPLFNDGFGFTGVGEKLIFLPKEHPRVVALEVMEIPSFVEEYHKTLNVFLEDLGYKVDKRDHYSHVSMARSPFSKDTWKKGFFPLPIVFSSLCLYESLGSLQYSPIWKRDLILPFEELDHVADIAFTIRGIDFPELFKNAQMSLCFTYPPLLEFREKSHPRSIEEVIIALNNLITRVDCAIGSPFKAVSFHGDVRKTLSQHLEWEMIVDV